MEYKHWRWTMACLILLSVAIALAEGSGDARDRRQGRGAHEGRATDRELLVRNERGAKSRETCRYIRGAWSECDSKTNIRSRTLTLKKGDVSNCERTKTIQKKCKKACRYEKSPWGECSPNGEMSRTDMLKANSDPTCDQSRRITKKCNKNKQVKSTKDKGRRNRQ